MFRATRRSLIVLVVVLVCLTGCQTSNRKSAYTEQGGAAKAQPRDLRIDRNVCSRATYQLDAQMIRIYWAGENSFGVDGRVQVSSRQAVIRYLSRESRQRLDHGILLVTARPGPGFDPLDALSQWCLKHDVNLYCVALTSGEPAEPAVQDALSASDWRSELPATVQCIVQARAGRSAEPRQASVADRHVAAGPVVAR